MDLARKMLAEMCDMMRRVGLETENYYIDPAAYTNTTWNVQHIDRIMVPDYLSSLDPAAPYQALPGQYDYVWNYHGTQTSLGAPFAASPGSDSLTHHDETDELLRCLVGMAKSPPMKKKENDVVVNDVTVMNVMRPDVTNESGQPRQPQAPPPNHLLQKEVQAQSATGQPRQPQTPPPNHLLQKEVQAQSATLAGTKPADPLTQSPCQPKTPPPKNLLVEKCRDGAEMVGMQEVDESHFTPSLPTQLALVLLFEEARDAARQLGGEYPAEVESLLQDLTEDAFEINTPRNKGMRLGVCTCCSTEEQIKRLRISLPIFLLRIMVVAPFVRVFLLLPPELFPKFKWMSSVYAAPLVTQSLIIMLHNFHKDTEWGYSNGYNYICHWAWKYGANVVSPTDFPEQFLRLWGSDWPGSK